MSLVARVASATLIGVEAVAIEVQTYAVHGPRRFSVVGLPDGVLREARDRVRCAIESCGISFPEGEVVVNLAPAAVPKSGAGFDMAIALSILATQGLINERALQAGIFFGELGLDGAVKTVPGALCVADLARQKGKRAVFLAGRGAAEAAALDGCSVFPVDNLSQLLRVLRGEEQLAPFTRLGTHALPPENLPTFEDVLGQHAAKRALEIAASGGHNVLMVGPPGAGKSMLASRFRTLLPELTHAEAVEVTKIHSLVAASGALREGLMSQRPLRSPHHSASTAGLIGGGSNPLPGEISLAHRGVLFLDEVTEFRREALEALRQPLENRSVVISRSNSRVLFPADFILIAAMNPCPCGRRGAGTNACNCSPSSVKRYAGRLSGPLLDRIDLQLWLAPVAVAELQGVATGEITIEDPTAAMKERVGVARAAQQLRYGVPGRLNSALSNRELRQWCSLAKDTAKFFETAAARLNLSARAFTRLLKVARTIADISGAEKIETSHIAEALSYRMQAGT